MSQKDESERTASAASGDGGGVGEGMPISEGDRLLAKDAASALNGPPVNKEALKGRLTPVLAMSVAAAAGGSSFIFGFNIGAVNLTGDIIKAWMNESFAYLHPKHPGLNDNDLTWLWSATVSMFALGGVFGGLLCGWMADKYGRKGAMMLNNFFCFVGAIFMSCSKLAKAYPMLMLGRLIIGFNCGLNSGLAPMYLTEIAPVNLRGMLGSICQLMMATAIFVANLLGLRQLFGTEHLWPVVLAFTVVPAVFQLALLPMCPESPKYLLVVKGQPQETEKALKRLRQKVDVSVELKATQDEADKIASVPKVKFGDMFRVPMLRWALTIAVMMMFAQQFSGINAAMYFSGQIFDKYAKLNVDEVGGATLGMCAVNVAMTVISTILVDRLGRRLLMLSGMAIMWVCSLLIVISLHLLMGDPDRFKMAAYFVIVFVFVFVIGFATGPGSIPWFYVSELFDQGARGNANAVAVMTNWFANLIVGLSFLPWAEVVKQFAFLMFTVFLTLFWLFTFFYVPETKGRQLEDIEEELRTKAPALCRSKQRA